MTPIRGKLWHIFLTYFTVRERIMLTDLFLLTYIRVWFSLSYNIGIKAHVQLLLPLFCTTSKNYILPVFCKQNLSKFQATGNKKFQYYSDQNSSMFRAIRGWLGAAYRNCSLEQEVSTGVRVSVSSWSENRNAILTSSWPAAVMESFPERRKS